MVLILFAILIFVLITPILLFSGIGITYQLSELLKQYVTFNHPFLTMLKIYIISVVIYLIYLTFEYTFKKKGKKYVK